jgi:hypothetical protein
VPPPAAAVVLLPAGAAVLLDPAVVLVAPAVVLLPVAAEVVVLPPPPQAARKAPSPDPTVTVAPATPAIFRNSLLLTAFPWPRASSWLFVESTFAPSLDRKLSAYSYEGRPQTLTRALCVVPPFLRAAWTVEDHVAKTTSGCGGWSSSAPIRSVHGAT